MRAESIRFASGSFGVDRVFEENIDLIAEYSLSRGDGACRQLEHRRRADTHGRHPPGFEILLNVNDHSVAVEIDGVDGEAHGEGVNAARRIDP